MSCGTLLESEECGLKLEVNSFNRFRRSKKELPHDWLFPQTSLIIIIIIVKRFVLVPVERSRSLSLISSSFEEKDPMHKWLVVIFVVPIGKKLQLRAAPD